MWETNKRVGCQLCYPFEEKRLVKWNCQVYVQPKLDGVRCRALRLNGKVTLLSSTEHIIFSVPHIEAQLENVIPIASNLELDGELYIHGKTFEEINSIVSRTQNLHPDYQTMEFHVFDTIHEELNQTERLHRLLSVDFTCAPNLFKVGLQLAANYEECIKALEIYMDLGYEGMIVRHPEAKYLRRRSTFIMKFKPKQFDSYLIVDYIEEHDVNGMPNGRMGRLVLTDAEGNTFPVYSGMTDEIRTKLWETRDELSGKYCHIGYQHLTAKTKVPRSAYFIEVKDHA